MKGAYYNEIDPYAAAWLRNLIDAGHIARGDVDERSIVDVCADDLRKYTQCHFFAGIGGWSLALRLAGWPDDRPAWTGSCPCQPLSSAGQRKGHADERHLWPEMFRLIRECRPTTIFGEQVASPDALQWWDGVSIDLEGAGYACGSADLCAAGVGAPHIRQRLYWVADSAGVSWAQHEHESRKGPRRGPSENNTAECREAGRVADLRGTRLEGRTEQPAWEERQAAKRGGDVGRVVQPNSTGCEQGISAAEDTRHGSSAESAGGNGGMGNAPSTGSLPGAHGGLHCGEESRGSRDVQLERSSDAWSNYDIIPCLDGKARRVESQPQSMAHGVSDYVDALRAAGASEDEVSAALCTFPLVQGGAGRVMLLRGLGNAIVPQVAAEFLRAYRSL